MISQAESFHHEHVADPRAWLAQFPAARRSAIANFFHYAVRSGATTPLAVLRLVEETLLRRLQWTSQHTAVAHLQVVLDVFKTDRAGTLAYARYVLDYEQLPYKARQRVKAARATPYLVTASFLNY